ncbi:ParB N-terminal domain-containing protein [Patescibacteria group bacterium]|nr:ParB N-terminal domain-containing protein [Patescibacteria group bacterium]
MAEKLMWHNEKRRARDLVSRDDNPNVNDERQFSKLKRSLKQSGYAEIIVVDIDGTIVAGAHRHKALMEMGMGDSEIDVRVPNRKLTKKEFDRYLIASNALRGSWDYNLLREFDQGLLLDLLGENDLSHLWDDQLEIEDDEFDEAAEIAKIKKPTVEPGDLLVLGDHRLLCASATDEALVRKLVGDTRINFVDVDPPFNIKYRYDGKNGKYGGSEKDDKSPTEYRTFLKSLITNSIAVSAVDAHYIFWCDERWVWLLQELYQEFGIDSKRLCIWVKDNAMPTPKVAFNKATEFAVYGTIGSPYINDQLKNLNTVLNKEVGSGARVIEEIVDLFNIWLVKRLPASEYEHPTQKPPTLHEKALRRCTRVGDTVLDLTAGSGSIMVACEQMKRRAFLCEVDPIFATVIKNRYEKLTGKKARKLA